MKSHMVTHIAEGWAIFANANQWVLCRARMRRQDSYWQPIAFIGSNKSVLVRVLREKRIKVSMAAQFQIDDWPEKFLDWRRLNAMHPHIRSTETKG